MTYVGRGVDAISNVEKLDNITFNGGTTYNLTKSSVAFTPSGANNILVSINGVIQQGNFTVAGATIIFDFSPTSNDTCNFIMHYGTGVLNVPADGVVSTAKVADDAITTDKLANSINSAITANTAKTTNATHSGEVTGATALTIADNIVDEANLKVSNSAVNGYSLTAQSGNTGGLTWASVGGTNTPNFLARMTSTQNVGSEATVIFNAEDFDTGSDYNVSNGEFTVPSDGKYFFATAITAAASYGSMFLNIRKAGTHVIRGVTIQSHAGSVVASGIVECSANDVVLVRLEMGTQQNLSTSAGHTFFCGFKLIT